MKTAKIVPDPPTWANTLNGRWRFWKSQRLVRELAFKAGYRYYAWDQKVYETGGPESATAVATVGDLDEHLNGS